MTYRASVRDDIVPDELSEWDGHLAGSVEPPRPKPDEIVEFAPIEEQVMTLARTDGLGSIEPPGRIERVFRKIFGLDPEHKALADPRLEALRRAFVVAHHRHHLPDVQAAELRENGFTVPQIRMIERRAIAA
jgi:hypothetical protein